MVPQGRPKDFGYHPVNHFLDHWPESGLRPWDAVVFFVLWRKRDFKTNIVANISQHKLSRACRLQRSRLNKSLTRLEQAGFIERKKGGGGRTTTYTICVPTVGSHFVPTTGTQEPECDPPHGTHSVSDAGDTFQWPSSTSGNIPDDAAICTFGPDSRATPALDTKIPF